MSRSMIVLFLNIMMCFLCVCIHEKKIIKNNLIVVSESQLDLPTFQNNNSK